MGLMGDRFEGKFEEHTIELVRTNLDKQCAIRVDGVEIASESVILPHTWDKDKEFDGGACGKKHKLHAHSALKKLFGFLPIDNDYTIQIDGQDIALTRKE